MAEIKVLFEMCDVDKDGEIEIEELSAVMTKMGLEFTAQQLTVMFNELDRGAYHDFLLCYSSYFVDKSGTISFNEFIGGLRWMNTVPALI